MYIPKTAFGKPIFATQHLVIKTHSSARALPVLVIVISIDMCKIIGNFQATQITTAMKLYIVVKGDDISAVAVVDFVFECSAADVMLCCCLLLLV